MIRSTPVVPICAFIGVISAILSLAELRTLAAAQKPDPSRWAVVTVDPALSDVSAMLTAELSRLDGVSLVERDEIQRVLGELQLTADGLVEPDKALRLGQVLSAEAIVLVDTVSGSNSVARARLVETRTGVRMWDWIGPRQNPDKQAVVFADELRPINVPLPADLRPQHPTTGPWAEYQAVPLRLKAPTDAGSACSHCRVMRTYQTYGGREARLILSETLAGGSWTRSVILQPCLPSSEAIWRDSPDSTYKSVTTSSASKVNSILRTDSSGVIRCVSGGGKSKRCPKVSWRSTLTMD